MTRSIPLADMRALIVCRGPIAMEAMEVAAALDMPPPDIVVAKREILESAEARAPWSEHRELYRRLHIVDDYRDRDEIVAIARRAGIDAVYVGYGYNAESAEFIARIEAAGLIPVAPASSVLAFSGSKLRAKRHVAEKLGIPVLPGSDKMAALALEGAGEERLIATAIEESRAVLASAPGGVARLKAARSGGGKGQRLVARPEQVEAAVREIWAEIGARGVDGDRGVLVEANLERPRHWEVQVLGDGETTVHFGARECSIQNVGSQKFIEVSLHPGQFEDCLKGLDAKRDAALIRELNAERERVQAVCDRAVRVIQSLGYRGAATVEFLVAEGADAYFMEINSRIQVEHRVSEAVALVREGRVRLVGEQFRIAAGERLGYAQGDIEFAGYAIETRINASHPNFLIGASGSVIESYRIPPTDDAFQYDDGGAAALFAARRRRRWAVPNFDSNFGLAVFSGADQRAALERAETELERFRIKGNAQLRTTRAFHLAAIGHLLAGAPYPKVRTDYAETMLAFGARVHADLAKLRATKPADGDPLDAWAAEAVGRFKEEPGLAIAFAARARRLGGKANGELLAALARLIEHPLRAEERAIAERERRELPAALKRVIEIVEAAGVFEFRRADSSLEFVVPESVASPRARRMLIEELRDTTLDRAATRPMSESEIEEIRRALSAMRGRSGGAFDEEVEACLSLVNHGASIEAETFGALFDGLRRLKWSIRRSGAPERDEREMLEGVGRAIELVRGPSVVAHLAGTVYLKPAPDKPPYVRPGDRVVEDETVVALIENMKMFNEIRAHVSGRVKEVRVENERPILPGEVILVIE